MYISSFTLALGRYERYYSACGCAPYTDPTKTALEADLNHADVGRCLTTDAQQCCVPRPCDEAGYIGPAAVCTCESGYGPGPVSYGRDFDTSLGGCEGISCDKVGYWGSPGQCRCENGYTGEVAYDSTSITGGCTGKSI